MNKSHFNLNIESILKLWRFEIRFGRKLLKVRRFEKFVWAKTNPVTLKAQPKNFSNRHHQLFLASPFFLLNSIFIEGEIQKKCFLFSFKVIQNFKSLLFNPASVVFFGEMFNLTWAVFFLLEQEWEPESLKIMSLYILLVKFSSLLASFSIGDKKPCF